MLNSLDLRDRQIRAAVREYKALARELHPVIKLDTPIQIGWRRFHALSEFAQRRADQPLLESILEVVGTSVIHHSREFRHRLRRRSKLVEIEQPLRPIPMHEWEKKNYPSEWWHFFQYELILELNKHWQPYWVFNQPSLFELKTERNWQWYFTDVDPGVATRLSELRRWLEARDGWCRYGWLKGRQQRYNWPDKEAHWDRALRREHQREIASALAQFPDADPAAFIRCTQVSARLTIISFSRRSPMQRQRAQTSSSAGASPAAGTTFQVRFKI